MATATPRRSSIAAIAPAAGANNQAIAAGATATYTFVVSEPCVLDRLLVAASQALVAPAAAAAATASTWTDCLQFLEITDFVVNADRLVSGSVPAVMFGQSTPADGPRGTSNPFLGHRVNQSSTVTVTIANRSGQGINVGVGISVL